jgi:hypothetical protein
VHAVHRVAVAVLAGRDVVLPGRRHGPGPGSRRCRSTRRPGTPRRAPRRRA